MNGWFPMQHDIVDSPVFHDADALRLFVWLSQRAAIKTQLVSMVTGKGMAVVELSRGSCIVGRKKSAEPLDWTESRFRYRLDKLEKWGLIRRKCATHWTVIDIVNYGILAPTEENRDQPNNQPNATQTTNQTTNQTPQMNKPKKPKTPKKPEETKDSFADKSAEPASSLADGELAEWIGWWNRLKYRRLVAAGTATEPNKGVRAGWQRVRRTDELRELLDDRDAITAAIEQAEFVRGSWFTLEKLFGGTNRDGAYIVQKLLDGGYAGTAAKSSRTANTGAGVNYVGGAQNVEF